MKTTNKLFQWRKTIFMTLPVMATLTFSSCTKDDGNDDIPPCIVTEWTKVDLSPLGSVAEIKFDLQSSDNG